MNKKAIGVFAVTACVLVAVFLTGCRMAVATEPGVSQSGQTQTTESQPELEAHEYRVLTVNRYKFTAVYGGRSITRTIYDLILANEEDALREYWLEKPHLEIGTENKLVWRGKKDFTLVLTEETYERLTGPM